MTSRCAKQRRKMISKVSNRILEGAGNEVAEFAQQHRDDRFQLIALSDEPVEQMRRGEPDAETWHEVMRVIHSFRGKLPILPLDATSTESLYG